MTPRRAWWLEIADGTRLPIKPAGVLIGRAPYCDVVCTDANASRAQAIVFAGPAGPCLTVLGKGATTVGGDAVARDRDLAAGDRIDLPGLALRVVTGDDAPAPPPVSTWVVRGRGRVVGVVRTPFAVGGSADADLRIDGWPDVVFRFHLAQHLHLEAHHALTLDHNPLQPGEVETLGPGAVIAALGERFEIIAGGTFGLDSTAGQRHAATIDHVHLEFLTRGGRLTVTTGGRAQAVYLPERRCDLIAALLQPPTPLAPGDFIPDDVLLPRIWPGRTMTRVDLNTLLHRARQDLLRAELDGTTLLPRADGGTATRFALDPGARVTVV